MTMRAVAAWQPWEVEAVGPQVERRARRAVGRNSPGYLPELTPTRSRQAVQQRVVPPDWPTEPPTCVSPGELAAWATATHTPADAIAFTFCAESRRRWCLVQRACGRCGRSDAQFARLVQFDGPPHEGEDGDGLAAAAGG